MIEQEDQRSYKRGVQLGHLSLAHVGNLGVVIGIDFNFNDDYYADKGGAGDDKDNWGGFVK